jgi:hypothetical protein
VFAPFASRSSEVEEEEEGLGVMGSCSVLEEEVRAVP